MKKSSAAGGLIHHGFKSLESSVCDELRSRIVGGLLPPGSRLIESSLAAELGVSRAPVRDAIHRLEYEGFVSISPRRGAAVGEMSVDDVMDCYDVREALEVVAHRLAARRRREEHVAELRRLLREGDAIVQTGRWAELATVNTAFHATVGAAARNQELAELLARYARRITWIFSQSVIASGQHAWSEHRAIAEAIEHQDENGVEALIRQHLANSRRRYLENIDIAG